MGLDAVELVMDVEDRFGIAIADDEAARIRTVGDLVTLIRDRVAAAAANRCMALPAFLSLRALVRDVAGNRTLRVRPAHAVTDLLSPTQRKLLWRRLPELIRTTPPPLRPPRPVRVGLATFSTIFVAVAIVAASVIDWDILPLTLLLAAVSVRMLYVATKRMRVVPPAGLAILSDITRKIVGLLTAATSDRLPDDEAILAELAPIIACVLGVDVDQVGPSARFVEDLGMG